MAGVLKELLMAVAVLVAAGECLAQGSLVDPTRPPSGVVNDFAPVGENMGPVLQSVLMPKKGKPVAVIGGQQIRLGEKYGESRLVRLSEREAVLEGPDGVERLQLTPGIEKVIVKKNRTEKTAAAGGVRREGNP